MSCICVGTPGLFPFSGNCSLTSVWEMAPCLYHDDSSLCLQPTASGMVVFTMVSPRNLGNLFGSKLRSAFESEGNCTMASEPCVSWIDEGAEPWLGRGHAAERTQGKARWNKLRCNLSLVRKTVTKVPSQTAPQRASRHWCPEACALAPATVCCLQHPAALPAWSKALVKMQAHLLSLQDLFSTFHHKAHLHILTYYHQPPKHS